MDKYNYIERLKDALYAEDYKVIKNAELKALGLQEEYDPQELHTERQAIRDEINRVQNMTEAEYWEAYPEEVEETPEEEVIEEPGEALPESEESPEKAEVAEPPEEGLEEEGEEDG